MENIAWTYTDATASDHPSNYDDLELQIISSATAYLNFTSFGYIDITNVSVSLPDRRRRRGGDSIAATCPMSA